MKRRKFLKPILIGLGLILAFVVVLSMYDMFIRNKSYEQIHPMESTLLKYGLSKACEERANGSFNPFSDSDGDYRIFYVSKADAGTLERMFINELGFSDNGEEFGELASYSKVAAGVPIYASVTAPESPILSDRARCQPVLGGDLSTHVKVQVPQGSLLVVITAA